MVTTHTNISLCLHIVYTHPCTASSERVQTTACGLHNMLHLRFLTFISQAFLTYRATHCALSNYVNHKFEGQNFVINQLFAKFTNVFLCLLYSNFILTMMYT